MPEFVVQQSNPLHYYDASADEIVEESHFADCVCASPRQSCSSRVQRGHQHAKTAHSSLRPGLSLLSKSGESLVSSVKSSGSIPRKHTCSVEAPEEGHAVISSVDSKCSLGANTIGELSEIASVDGAVRSVSSSCERADHAILNENDSVEVDDSTLMYDYCEEDAKALQQSRARDVLDDISEEIDVGAGEGEIAGGGGAAGRSWHDAILDEAAYDSYDEHLEAFQTPRLSPVRDHAEPAEGDDVQESMFDEISAHLQLTAEHPYLCMLEQERAIAAHRNMRHMDYCSKESRAQEFTQYDRSILIKALVGEAHRHQAQQCKVASGNSWSPSQHRAGWNEIAVDVERTLLMEGPMAAQRRISCMCVFNPRKLMPPEIDGGDDERLRRMERQEQLLQQMYHQRVLGGNPHFLESGLVREGVCTPHPFTASTEDRLRAHQGFTVTCNQSSNITASYDVDSNDCDGSDDDGDDLHDEAQSVSMFHELKAESCYSSIGASIPSPSYSSKLL